MLAAYVLHRWPYQESGLMCDVVTAEHGRVRVVARGARRPKSPWRGILQPFVPLQVQWRGRGDMPTLVSAEGQAPALTLQSERLYSGFYVNELMQRVTTPWHALEQLFEGYAHTLQQLVAGPLEPTLRSFEWQLLQFLGQGIDFYHDCLSGEPLPTIGWVQFTPGAGFSTRDAEQVPPVRRFAAAEIVALQSLEIQHPAQLSTLKRLLRLALQPYVGEQPLRSRELFASFTQRGS